MAETCADGLRQRDGLGVLPLIQHRRSLVARGWIEVYHPCHSPRTLKQLREWIRIVWVAQIRPLWYDAQMTTAAARIASEATLAELLDSEQQAYLAASTEGERKARGQFFTPWSVAAYMASLVRLPQGSIRLLDPGAGAGALTVAFCERLLHERPSVQLHVDLFETDAKVLPHLHRSLAACQAALGNAGGAMTYQAHKTDFVPTMAPAPGQLFDDDIEPYDAVIANPPYFKINKASPYAAVMPEIIHGQPNIYAIFLAIAAARLRDGGSMVAITPRSFCNGLYFRAFRRWLLDRVHIDRVHLFRSRTDTFREANVLQESVITAATRTRRPALTSIISRSENRELTTLHEQELPASHVVCRTDPDRVIFLPETNEDAEVVKYAQAWKHPFEGVGLRISTGPVVMFRTKEFLLDDGEQGVPLLSSHNVRRFETRWPVSKAKWPLAFADEPASQKHLVETRNYVLLKRFSSKEERRRLTAGCLLRRDQHHQRIAIENHLNYIYHAERELSEVETLGVASIFNSVFFDRYFRTLSGNTQVNATEVRALHFPPLVSVARIGERVKRSMLKEPANAEHLVLEEIGVNGSLRTYLEGIAQ